MCSDFLARYLESFNRIPGWFSPDAYLLVAAYNQLLTDEGLFGDVLEIGVHHGLSAIGFAALRGQEGRFVAVDPFPAPGMRIRFLENFSSFYEDLSFLTTIEAPSASVQPRDLGSRFTVCHIDGWHGEREAYADLELCAAILRAGGLVVLDDYFNPAYPGVGEAAVRFKIEHPGTFRPIAIGFNKALFQREPVPFDLNACFTHAFPQVGSDIESLCGQPFLWDTQVRCFDRPFRDLFDCSRSTLRRLVAVNDVAAASTTP
jgi:hypothetical protein